MTRLFSLTISVDKTLSDFEGEQIVRVSWKCGICNGKRSYTTNEYITAFDEIKGLGHCKCETEGVPLVHRTITA